MAKVNDRELKQANQREEDALFIADLLQKLQDAKSKPEFIFNHTKDIILRDGFISMNPLQFNNYSSKDKEYYKNITGIPGDELWLRPYLRIHPGKSLADALRAHYGVKCPEVEAGLMICNYDHSSQKDARIMLDVTQGEESWVQHWRLRGPDHLYQTFESAIALDASRFAGVCESSLEEVERLDSQAEIEALNEIQSVMLRVLWAHRKEAKGDVRRRVEEVIQALKVSLRELEEAAAWILPTIEEVNESGDTAEARIRFAGLALLNEGRILAMGEDGQDTLSWRQLLKKWPLKTDEEHPYTLGELLAEMYRQDDDITLKALRGNCDREAVNGGPEKDAWEDFMKEALRLVRQWESDADGPKPDLAATRAAIHKALGIEPELPAKMLLINYTPPKRTKPVNENLRKNIFEALAQGLSYGEVANRIGISKSSVAGYVRRDKERLAKANDDEENKYATRTQPHLSS